MLEKLLNCYNYDGKSRAIQWADAILSPLNQLFAYEVLQYNPRNKTFTLEVSKSRNIFLNVMGSIVSVVTLPITATLKYCSGSTQKVHEIYQQIRQEPIELTDKQIQKGPAQLTDGKIREFLRSASSIAQTRIELSGLNQKQRNQLAELFNGVYDLLKRSKEAFDPSRKVDQEISEKNGLCTLKYHGLHTYRLSSPIRHESDESCSLINTTFPFSGEVLIRMLMGVAHSFNDVYGTREQHSQFQNERYIHLDGITKDEFIGIFRLFLGESQKSFPHSSAGPWDQNSPAQYPWGNGPKN